MPLPKLELDWNPEAKGTKEMTCRSCRQSTDYRLRCNSTWKIPNLWMKSNSPINKSTGLPAKRVNQPSGGEIWRAGTTESIRWQANTLYAGNTVRLELWRDREKDSRTGHRWNPNARVKWRLSCTSATGSNLSRASRQPLWNPSWLPRARDLSILTKAGYAHQSIRIMEIVSLSRLWQEPE